MAMDAASWCSDCSDCSDCSTVSETAVSVGLTVPVIDKEERQAASGTRVALRHQRSCSGDMEGGENSAYKACVRFACLRHAAPC